MAEYNSNQIRNISIIGHGGSGKTTMSEAMLYASGAVNRFGKVEEGNTASDYHRDEVEKKMSINSSLLSTFWKNSKGEEIKINIMDTPGFMDFIGEVVSSLRVTDTSLLMIDAVKGREVGTEIVFRNTKHYDNNVVFVINKLDQENVNFDNVVSQLKESFGSHVTVIQFPVRTGQGFDAVIDVARMKMLKFGSAGKGEYTEEEIPDEFKEKAREYHSVFVENIAEEEEKLMEKFFEGGDLSAEDINYGLHKGMKERLIFPVFCAAAAKGIGVQPVLDFIVNYGESPIERTSELCRKPHSEDMVELNASADGEPTIFMFKTVSEKNIGELSFFRVYSGKVKPGMDLINEASGKGERLSQLFSMTGKERKDMSEVICGDIAATVKLKDTHTNNTLSSKSAPVILNEISFPDPNMTLAIEAKNKGDEDKISAALHSFHEEDPTFIVHYNTETNQTLISGQGEVHLTTVIQRMKSKYNLDVDISEPRIPYRETIKRSVKDIEYKHKKQSGGRGQFGHVHISIEPLPRGEGFQFQNAIVGGVVPGRFIPAVEKGVHETMSGGILVGRPVVDVKVTLFDGSFHPVDSDELSFKLASSQAFKKGFKEANPVLLEPIYYVEVVFPEEFMGAVSGDVSSRRGRILGMETEGHLQLIKCHMPLSEMSGYSSKLRSLTQGRGTYKRKFDHYDEVPKEVETKIISEHAKENGH